MNNRMDIYQQIEFMHKVVDDIKWMVGCNVTVKQTNDSGGRFSLNVCQAQSDDVTAFGLIWVYAKKNHMELFTWDKYLTGVGTAVRQWAYTYSRPFRKSDPGLSFLYGRGYEYYYPEILAVLRVACKYCLRKPTTG